MAEARLKFDFDRASSVMAAIASCFGSKAVSPQSLNPYRAVRRDTYSVDEIERSHAALVKAGKHIEQTIPMSQVVNDV